MKAGESSHDRTAIMSREYMICKAFDQSNWGAKRQKKNAGTRREGSLIAGDGENFAKFAKFRCAFLEMHFDRTLESSSCCKFEDHHARDA